MWGWIKDLFRSPAVQEVGEAVVGVAGAAAQAALKSVVDSKLDDLMVRVLAIKMSPADRAALVAVVEALRAAVKAASAQKAQ